MAAPRHGFGAHDDGSSLLGPMNELVQGFLKFWRLHVVGKAPEAGISPTSIDRVTTRMLQAAQSSHMPVTDPGFLERTR
jgi:hypothetical protein